MSDLMVWCPHVSHSGAERPILEMGRFPVLWKCDSCGALSTLEGGTDE